MNSPVWSEMCGILGGVGARARMSGPLDSSLLRHRGPDACGSEILHSGGMTCWLSHTRLRIIDLSADADQPLANEDGTVWVVYNGELYNHAELRADLVHAGHAFRSRSDTEVLVHLYEEHRDEPGVMLHRLRGMFAFALFDTVHGRLLLARDRLGIKPLYWTDLNGGLAFASEVRALARATGRRDPDRRSVAGYLAWGVVPGPRTIVAGIRALPPGSHLTWQRGRHQIRRWWRPDPHADWSLAADAPGVTRAVLRDSVARHLIADRPVGVFLSSGLDSTAVAKLAAAGGKVRTLTVTFPEVDGDEGHAAASIARRIGADHREVPVTGRVIAERTADIIGSMDQPSVDGVNTWVVCRAARQAGLVVALSGLGGDELFGGYPSFRQVPRLRTVAGWLGVVPRPLRWAAARNVSSHSPGGPVARLLAAEPGDSGAYRALRGLFSPAEAAVGVGAGRLDLDGTGPGRRPADARDRVMLLELGHYLPNQLLRDTDQMSMAHSLEVRVPLLDDAVVRAALALPPRIRTAGAKHLLAAAAQVTEHTTKRPFALPFDHWIEGPLRDPVREGVLSESLPFSDMIPAGFRRSVWDGFEAGRVHWSRPWALAVLRLWPATNGFNW